VKWFRRRRPTVNVQQISREDIHTAHVWGLTLTEWFALTDVERADRRFHLALAPKLVDA